MVFNQDRLTKFWDTVIQRTDSEPRNLHIHQSTLDSPETLGGFPKETSISSFCHYTKWQPCNLCQISKYIFANIYKQYYEYIHFQTMVSRGTRFNNAGHPACCPRPTLSRIPSGGPCVTRISLVQFPAVDWMVGLFMHLRPHTVPKNKKIQRIPTHIQHKYMNHIPSTVLGDNFIDHFSTWLYFRAF